MQSFGIAPILKNLTFCTTGLHQISLPALADKIVAMGGVLVPEYSRRVDFLLCDVDTVHESKKYLAAQADGVPCVRYDWIDECWQRVHLSSSNNLESERQSLLMKARSTSAVGGLMGCTICVSGVNLKEREEVALTVSELLGNFSGQFDEHVTHLICVPNANTSDAKIRLARQRGVHCVTIDWLLACKRVGHLVGAEQYAFEASIRNENPIASIEILENCSPFLSGCHILLAGDQDHPNHSLIRKMILSAGGFRETDLNSPSLTHIVVIDQLFSRQLLNKNKTSLIVEDSWIADSYLAQERLSEEAYLVEVPIPSTKSDVTTTNTFGALKSAFSFKQNISFVSSQPSQSTQTTQVTNARFSQQVEREFNKCTVVGKEATYFLASSVEESKRKKLAARAKARGVALCSRARDADFVVFPCAIKSSEVLPPGKTVITEVLFGALLEGLKEKSDFSVSLSVSYARPIVIVSQLVGCTFSQTGFTGHDRAFQAAVLSASGAQYTEVLSKQNTHLLCPPGPPQGDKQQYARKWGIVRTTWPEVLAALRGDAPIASQPVKSSNQRRIICEPPPLNLSTVESQPKPLTVSASVDEGPLFKGLVFAMSQRLHHRRDALVQLIELHGGVVLWSLNRHCTHYLHHGNQVEEVFREFRRAREWRLNIIHPQWIEESIAYGRRMEESAFPHTLGRHEKSEIGNSVLNSIVNMTCATESVDVAMTQVLSPLPPFEPFLPERQQENEKFDWNAAAKERMEKASSVRLGTILDTSKFPKVRVDEELNLPLRPIKISLTGFTAEEKAALKASLPSNFGFMEAPSIWRPSEIILVTAQDEPLTSHKYTAACAGGCWILKRGFLEAIKNNPLLAADPLAQPSLLEEWEVKPAWASNNRSLKAPRHWRLQGGGVVFAGWRFKMSAAEGDEELRKNSGYFRMILRSGGAVEDENNPTHLITMATFRSAIELIYRL